MFRQITPATNYQLGSNTVQWIQETVGATTGISYSMPRAFDSQSFDLSYSFARIGGQLPLARRRELNPYDIPSIPTRGTLGTLHLGWGYSNAEGYLWSVGNEKGFDVERDLRPRRPRAGERLHRATRRRSTWRRTCTCRGCGTTSSRSTRAAGSAVAIAAGEGRSTWAASSICRSSTWCRTRSSRAAVELRGYPVVAEAGNYYALFNAEYRFPIVNVDRGPSTLPIFLNRISGAASSTTAARSTIRARREFKTGVGGELWFDLTLGYILGFTFRAGFARASRERRHRQDVLRRRRSVLSAAPERCTKR